MTRQRLDVRPLIVLAAGLFALWGLPTALGSTAPAAAQSAQASPHLSGRWRLAMPLPQAEQAIQRAVRPAIARLSPDMQRMARARLAESTWIPQQLVINASSAQISVQVIGQENRTFTSVPGQPQNVYSRSGVRASLTQRIRPDGGLEQQLRALDGTQVNFYRPAADGRSMSLDVLIQSPRFSQDVRFQIPFTRQ